MDDKRVTTSVEGGQMDERPREAVHRGMWGMWICMALMLLLVLAFWR